MYKISNGLWPTLVERLLAHRDELLSKKGKGKKSFHIW